MPTSSFAAGIDAFLTTVPMTSRTDAGSRRQVEWQGDGPAVLSAGGLLTGEATPPDDPISEHLTQQEALALLAVFSPETTHSTVRCNLLRRMVRAIASGCHIKFDVVCVAGEEPSRFWISSAGEITRGKRVISCSSLRNEARNQRGMQMDVGARCFWAWFFTCNPCSGGRRKHPRPSHCPRGRGPPGQGWAWAWLPWARQPSSARHTVRRLSAKGRELGGLYASKNTVSAVACTLQPLMGHCSPSGSKNLDSS